MKRVFWTLIGLLLLLTSCDENAGVEDRLSVGVVYGLAGSADKSFNEAVKFAVTGLAAEQRFVYEWREPRDIDEMESFTRELASDEHDVVLFAGDPAYLEPVVTDYPEVDFILVGGELEAPNVRALSFQSGRAAAAVGAVAALEARGGQLGFIGGFDDRDARRVLSGFQQGARLVNPEVVFHIDFINSADPAAGDPQRARELAERQYERGVEVIFAYCGRDIETLATVAAERDAFIIGSDLNQNWLEKGHVLTSMMRDVSEAVGESLDAALNGSFTPGLVRIPPGGENGLGYFVDETNRELLPPETRETVERVLRSMDQGMDSTPQNDGTTPPDSDTVESTAEAPPA